MVPPRLHVGESEAPQESEILPRWGKMSVPAKTQTSLRRYCYKEKTADFIIPRKLR